MAKAHVYSKLANSQKYAVYGEAAADIKPIIRHIHIHGGAGIASKQLITPLGVHTEIDDADVAVLEADPTFKIHKARGLVTIERHKKDPERVAADLSTSADPSGPVSPAHFEDADGLLGKGMNGQPALEGQSKGKKRL